MTNNLAQQWQALKDAQPRLRIRDAADQLGVCEAQLLGTRLGDGVTRLVDEAEPILNALGACGLVKSIVRNNACVHEKVGEFGGVRRVHGPIATVVNGAIDLRLFLNHWANAFFVVDSHVGHELTSVQFFDHHGGAILKAYATEATDLPALAAIKEAFRHGAQEVPAFTPRPTPVVAQPGPAFDLAEFRQAWLAMQDTHDFGGLLRKHAIGRTVACRLAPEGMAKPVATTAGSSVLRFAQEAALPLMVFTGNSGCIQIHSGPVHTLGASGPWFNVMDREFNLHLKEQLVTEAWVVRKPTADGIVSSLELFDVEGSEVALFFGTRKPGMAENPHWTELLDTLPAA